MAWESDKRRYLWEAQAHANELLELYDLETREQMVPWLERGWETLDRAMTQPAKEVFVFLGEGPTAQERRLAKMPTTHQHVLWSQARYQALQAANAIELALTVHAMLDGGYRKAVRSVAQAVSKAPAPPSPWDLALLQLPD